MTTAYKQSGVDVEAGYEVVERIKQHTEKTNRLGVMGALGGFGGCFDLSQFDIKEPVLVSGTDGVGTKLLLAIEANQHDTIGIDCVAMCVNDILAQGAEPLYFLDYIATGKTIPEKVEEIVSGVAQGCLEANMALIGGETAEMPGMYGESEYDIAGFAVGVAEKGQLITGKDIHSGDVLIGLPSSGIHSNGYSLVRHILFTKEHYTLETRLPELAGLSLQDVLLTPTKIYVSSVLPVIQAGLVKGISHITGGGFYENIPRILPDDFGADIELGTWDIPSIFKVLEEKGRLSQEELYGTFNMGIGMILVVSTENQDKVRSLLLDNDQESIVIGKVTSEKLNKVKLV